MNELKSLFETQKPHYEIKIGMTNLASNAKCAFTFCGLFGKQVTSCRLSEGDFSCSSNLEGFFGPGVGFHFWHKKSIFKLPLLVTSNRRSTYGTIWEYFSF
jgi:hypothetical protein